MSVRVTRKIKRVLHLLAGHGPATVPDIRDATKISITALWPVLDRLHDHGWIEWRVSDRTYAITGLGTDGLKTAEGPQETPEPAKGPRPRHPYPMAPRRRQ